MKSLTFKDCFNVFLNVFFSVCKTFIQFHSQICIIKVCSHFPFFSCLEKVLLLHFNFWLIFVPHNAFVWPQCFQSPKTGCALTLHEALGGVQDRGESSSLEGGRQCQEITQNPTRGGEGVSDGTVGWIWRRFDAPSDTELSGRLPRRFCR